MNSLISLGIALPLFVAAVLLVLRPGAARWVAAITASLSALCFLFASQADAWLPVLHREALTELPSETFSFIALAAILLLPRQDATPKALAGILFHTASTHLCYASSSMLLLAVGWWMTLLPFLMGLFGKHPHQRWMHGFFMVSAILVTVGAVLPSLSVPCFLAAVVLRKGVFPFHGGSLGKFEFGPLVPASLLFNSHLGAVLILRMPEHPAQEWLGIAALVSAVLLALRTFGERAPRRMLGLISLSQASFILAGLTHQNEASRTGAMLHWMVVSISCVGLAAVLRAVEVRVASAREPQGHLGLAVKAPRLATFFLLCSLALIGLPGTLGYAAEDLLFHGALEEHVILGLALPLATAFNAIHLMRLFGILFLGVLPKHVADVPDALPRERWPLAAACAFLVITGLMPRLVLPLAEEGAAHPGHTESK
jgi:NADH-quinone oxidoreductase subunit M